MWPLFRRLVRSIRGDKSSYVIELSKKLAQLGFEVDIPDPPFRGPA